MAYNEKNIIFANLYHPKPWIPGCSPPWPGCSRAAIDSGVAQTSIDNWKPYAIELNNGWSRQPTGGVLGSKARNEPKRLVFAEADNLKILKVARSL